MAFSAEAIVEHLYHPRHNSSFVAFVTKQGHLGIAVELEKAGIVGRYSAEDGEENTQDFLLALFVLDREGLRCCQATAVEYQETEFSLGALEPED